MITPQHYLNNS